jgi:hypothetical protein
LPGTQAFVNFLSLEKALAETTTMTNMPMIHDSFVKGFVKDFLKVMRFVHGLSCVWEPSLHLHLCTKSRDLQHLQLSSCPMRPAAKQASQLVDLENEDR